MRKGNMWIGETGRELAEPAPVQQLDAAETVIEVNQTAVSESVSQEPVDEETPEQRRASRQMSILAKTRHLGWLR